MQLQESLEEAGIPVKEVEEARLIGACQIAVLLETSTNFEANDRTAATIGCQNRKQLVGLSSWAR